MNPKTYLILRNGYEYAEAEGRQTAEPEADLSRCNQHGKHLNMMFIPSLKAANEFLCPQDGQSERYRVPP